VHNADLQVLVRTALDDDPGALLRAAASELGRPVGVARRSGQPLGHAPDDEHGRRALAVAEAAARVGLVTPPGWQIHPLPHRLGFIAVGGEPNSLVEIVAGLLGDQIQRRDLVRAHQADFVRRLVYEPPAELTRLRREARELGVPLADVYWPALLAWRDGPPRDLDGLADGIDGALAVEVSGRWVLLQAAGGDPGWFKDAVLRARRIAPASGAQAIVARGPVELRGLSAAVAELETLWRYGARANDEPLLRADQFALDRLLATVARGREARAFVQDQVGALVEWDARHRGDLVRVLEAALDHPRHDHAAQRCFMHRNTFRHRLRQATEILGRDLDDPDARLAVHVALKLRRVL